VPFLNMANPLDLGVPNASTRCLLVAPGLHRAVLVSCGVHSLFIYESRLSLFRCLEWNPVASPVVPELGLMPFAGVEGRGHDQLPVFLQALKRGLSIPLKPLGVTG